MRRENLIARRKKLGLTQAQVAAKAGMDRSHYSLIEAGKFDEMTLKKAIAIGQALNYKVDQKCLFSIVEAAKEDEE